MTRLMLIKAAVNGSRRPDSHPALPLTPDALASAAAGAVAAGAGAIHLHVRGADGSESLAADDVARTLTAVKRLLPATPIGVSTGAWIVPDPTERHALVAGWTVLPDFASVNFHEEGATALANLLFERGVGVEAGLCDASAAARWAESGIAGRCLRVLLEPQDAAVPDALRTAREIEAVLDAAGIPSRRLLHGAESTAWPLLDEAAQRGYDSRIGLEDTLGLPDGSVASENAALVREARRRIAAARGIEIA